MPTEADRERLRTQRSVIEALIRDEDSRLKYQTPAGKVGLIRAILQKDIFTPTQTYELQCLGIVLGDAFAQELKMEWITVEDEYGRDPALRLPGTSIILFPLTMLSKRIERGEKIDIFDLFNGVAAEVDKVRQRAR